MPDASCCLRLGLAAVLLAGVSCSRRGGSSAPSQITDVRFDSVVVDNEAQGDQEYFGDVKSVGDIDGDGYPDIVFGGNQLAWYSYPKWTRSLISISDEQFSTDMQVADIDGDRDLDVIVPDGRKGKISWFENPRPGGDPHALWKAHLIGYQREWAHDVEIADMNGDGKLDVVTRKTHTIVWLQSDPDRFVPVTVQTSEANGEGTALADINGDGLPDIVQNGYWLENPGNPMQGNWAKHVIAEGWPSQLSIVVADIDSDELPDVVLVPAESAGRLSWYKAPRNPATGKWTEDIIDSDVAYVHSLKTGDFNNDGRPDVVAAEMHQSKQRRVSVYLKAGSSWRKEVISTKGSHNLRVADIGNDGDLDIVGANWGGDYHPLELWENKLIDRQAAHPDSNWSYLPVDSHRAKWGDFDQPGYVRYLGLAFGDLNGDGAAEIVSGRYVYRNPGRGKQGDWTRSDLGVNVDAMLVTDVDGDGQPDVIAESLPAVYWLKPLDREATGWQARLIGTVPATEHVNSQGYVLAQIVTGGRPEVVLSSGDGIYYFEVPDQPAAGRWPRHRITADASEEGIGVGDLDGDGDLDIAAAGKDGHSLFWWENPGNGQENWTRHAVGTTAEWADRCAIADINQDGRNDIVLTEETTYSGASVYWFEQPASPKTPDWPRHTVVTQYSTNSLDVADMNHDGAPDLITGEHRGTRKVAIWLNVDHGARWIEDVVDLGKENHLGTRVADLDGDGIMEIAGIGWDTYPFLHLWKRNKNLTAPPQTVSSMPVTRAANDRTVAYDHRNQH